MLINDPFVPVATEADLVNANRLLIQTASGTKQLPADIVGNIYSIVGIQYSFSGKGTTAITYKINTIKNCTYTFTPSTTSWAVTSISASASKLIIRSVLADGTTRDDKPYLRDATIPASIDFTVPNDAVALQLFVRADVGQTFTIDVKLKNVNSLKDVNERRQLYIDSGSLYVEESKTANGKIWVKADGGGAWTSRLTGYNIYENNTAFATRLGVSLETSGLGVTGCIPISHLECLVANWKGLYEIKNRDNILESDVVVFGCVNGYLAQANTDVCAMLFSAFIAKGTAREANFPRQVYGAERDNIYIEESRLTSGKVWFKVYDGLTIRLGTSESYNNSQLASLFSKTVETSPAGMPNCIPLSNLDCIIFRDKALSLVSRSNLKMSDVVLLAVVDGRVIGGNSELARELQHPTDKTYVYRKDIDSIYTKIETVLNGGLCDKFLFFTDPHCLTSADKARRNFMWLVENVKNVQVPVNFTLSGGDWLGSGDTAVQAIERLGIMTDICNKGLFNFKQLVGNHDTNYLGTGVSPRFSQNTIDSVMFGGGKSYYDFETPTTRYFAFDTGIEEDVTDYEKEQIAWFANALLTNKKEHIAVLAHILTNDYGEGYDSSNFTLYYMAQVLMDIAVAFNARTSVTKYGETYDFSVAEGYIEFFLGGHTHKDFGRLINDIPVVMTKNYNISSDPANNAIDLVIPNYTTKKLNLIRIGSGSDRNFDLFSASL